MAATNKRGVFSLEKVLERQSDNNWSKIPEVFRYVNSLGGTPNVGYFGAGGYNPRSIVDRVDFDNDTATASPKGNMSSARYRCSGIGNKDFGYFGSGTIPGGAGDVTTVDRLDYANDTADMVAKGPLANVHRTNDSTVGNNDFGYWCGSVGRSYVSRVDYGNDTATAVEKGPLVMNRSNAYGVTSPAYGYICGGETPSRRSSIDRIDFNSDTSTATPKGNLSGVKDNGGATGNASYGYIGGGSTPSPVSTIDRIDFSNDTATAVTKGPLGRANWLFSATGNTSYGYWGGGYATPSNDGTSFVDRVDYSNDTATASPKGNLSVAYRNTNSFSPRENALSSTAPPVPATRTESEPISPALLGNNHGYWTAGQVYNGGSFLPTSTIDRLDFDNDTNTAVAKGPLSRTVFDMGAVGNKPYGYVAGGYTTSASSIVDRIDYGNDTATTAVKGPLSSARRGVKGVGNLSYGYFGGGEPGPFSTVDRVDYANDTATAAPKGPMSSARRRQGSVSNLSHGYIAGGQPYVSTVDRIDFSNDTATASPKAPLSTAKRYVMGAGTNSHGYFAGGSQPNYISTIDRLDYASDTTAMVPAGPLWETQWAAGGGTGNASYAYFGGGFDSADPISHTARLDYANDTATALSKGKLSSARFNLVAVSSRGNGQSSPTTKTVDKGADGYSISTPTDAANHGYFAGGYDYAEPSGPTADMTLIQRIDFTNDTATALLKGNLSSSPGVHKSTSSNGSYGYIVGGNIVPSVTRVDRLDYTNDTATTSIRGPITGPVRGALAGAGNNDYGWHTGGIYAIPSRTVYSKVDRIDYSNDSSTASPKGNLAAARGYHNATGTLNYGYFAAGTPDGQFGPNSSTVQRIDYGNDTAISSPKGPLSRGTSQHASTGNANYGWFIGGYGPNSRSKIDRIDYASDTAVASVRGPLYQPSYRLDGTGNSNYGYVHPGLYPGNPAGPGGSTEIARIDYSNDTITTGIRGHFARSMRIQESAFSAAENGRNPVITSYTPRIRWVDSVAEAPAFGTNPLGYLGGGRDGGTPLSTVDKIDYSNDTATASVAGSLTLGKRGVGAAGNNFFAYFAGGNSPSASPGSVSSIDRLDYSNDSTDTLSKGNLSFSNYGLDGVGNANFGYFASSDYPLLSTVNRVDYSNDTATAADKGPLSNPVDYAGAAGNQSFGYFAGGGSPVRSTIDRIDYSNDTPTASPKGPLQAVKRSFAATGNASFGYWGGGYSGPSQTTTIDRLDYSSDTSTSLKGPLSIQRVHHSAVGNASFGYFAGGETPGESSTVDRLDYSNDTSTATPKGNISVGRVQFKGASAQEENGLTATAAIAAPVQPPFPYPEQLPAPAPGHGYYVSGDDNATPNPATTKIGRIDFSNDTATTVLKGNMHTGRRRHTSFANQTHGYTGGGSNPAASPAYLSSIERMTFANDTATSVDKSTFREAFTQVPSPGQGANAAVSIGGPAYGYWQAGNATFIDRIDYANDTAQASAKTNSTITSNSRSAVSNTSYGYFCGGHSNKSVVDRIDYSNDTATASVRGNLVAAVSHNFGIGNGNYGYIVAGRNPGFPSDRSDVQRIDFADDTATSSPKGPLAGTTYNGAGTGDASYGYVVQAQVNAPSFGYYTRIFRIDYSNDTATAAERSAFSWPGSQLRGFSGRAFGFPN